MGNYVILNFEDPIGQYLGPLQATTAGIRVKKPAMSGHQVSVYDCVELLDKYVGNVGGGVSAHELTALTHACQASDRIYVVMHGDPRQAQFGFASGNRQLCRYDAFAAFIHRLIPKRNGRYTISMIMCYGGRSATWQHALVDHQEKIPPQYLATSFAYLVFKEICTTRSLRLTARTGRVNHDPQGRTAVEEDMALDEFFADDEYSRDITANRPAKLAVVMLAKQQYLLGGGTEQGWTLMWNKHLTDENAVAVGPEEALIKPYHAWLTHDKKIVGDAYLNAFQAAGAMERTKYGKLVYTFNHGKLKIVNRYGNPHNKKMKANTVLYSGPLL
jgi:hypothetical protein